MKDRRSRIRTEILTQLYGYRPGVRPAERIARLARMDGEFDSLSEREIKAEAEYLIGRGLVEAVPNPLARFETAYRITSAGIDYAEGEGIV